MLTLLRLATNFSEGASTGGRWLSPTKAKSTCRLATGRSALFHLISRLPETYAKTVFLPSYIAEGVLKPFAASGYEMRHYRLTPELQPDENDVANLLQCMPGPVIFVLVHYFGKPSASPGLLAMLRRAGALIVSDCAHAPLSRTKDGVPLGELGDIALYSLNKLLPVCDGAILFSLSPEIDVTLDERALPLLPSHVTEAYERHLIACRKLFDATDPQAAYEYLAGIESAYDEYYKFINDNFLPHRQSHTSQHIESIFPYDESADIRRKHAARLHEVIASNKVLCPHWEELEGHLVPFAYPVRVSAESRNVVQKKFFENGVLASTLYEKWNFVPPGDEKRFVVEEKFLREHLLLPVSEFMSDEDISHLERTISSIH